MTDVAGKYNNVNAFHIISNKLFVSSFPVDIVNVLQTTTIIEGQFVSLQETLTSTLMLDLCGSM